MEPRIITLGQQQQQIQPRHFTPLAIARRLESGRGKLVKGEELLEVPRESVGVLEADGEERAGFERRAGEVEERGGGGGGGEQGVEGEELAFCGCEEGGDFSGGGEGGGLELGEGGVQFGCGHTGRGRWFLGGCLDAASAVLERKMEATLLRRGLELSALTVGERTARPAAEISPNRYLSSCQNAFGRSIPLTVSPGLHT